MMLTTQVSKVSVVIGFFVCLLFHHLILLALVWNHTFSRGAHKKNYVLCVLICILIVGSLRAEASPQLMLID